MREEQRSRAGCSAGRMPSDFVFRPLDPLIALALCDEESRTNDVMPRLKNMGQWFIDAFTVCKMGAHERHEGELKLLIDNSKRLAPALQVMP